MLKTRTVKLMDFTVLVLFIKYNKYCINFAVLL